MRGGAVRGAAAALVLLAAPPAAAEGVAAARFAAPTDRYDHAVLGDAIEWGALEIVTETGRRLTLTLPRTRVFEDLAPRRADIDGDGDDEVFVVETDLDRGARLSVYDAAGLVAATPFIGRRHRWLAPVGVADLDGDGTVEIAYVDRPHLAAILRVWRYRDGALHEVAASPGLTNHRLGQAVIQGGIARCADGPAIVTADAAWRRVIVTTLRRGHLSPRDTGPYTGPDSLAPDQAC